MLPRPTRQDDEEEWEVEQWYGKPQHETGRLTSEQELYGDPQHDIPDERSSITSDFDLDLGYALDVARLDIVRKAGDTERRLLSAVKRQ